MGGADDVGIGNGFKVVVGDFDGNGVDDVAVSSHVARNRDGGVWVFFGPLDEGFVMLDGDADATFFAETEGAWLGTDVAAADLDGDGVDSLVVGASMNGPYGDVARAGLVYVMQSPLPRGVLGPEHVQTVLRGGKLRDNAGWSVEGCDVNRDGRDELIIGADYHDHNRRNPAAGRVYWVESVPAGPVP